MAREQGWDEEWVLDWLWSQSTWTRASRESGSMVLPGTQLGRVGNVRQCICMKSHPIVWSSLSLSLLFSSSSSLSSLLSLSDEGHQESHQKKGKRWAPSDLEPCWNKGKRQASLDLGNEEKQPLAYHR